MVRSDVDVLFTTINMPGLLNGSAPARIVDMHWLEIAIIATCGRRDRLRVNCPTPLAFCPSSIHPQL
jgi:hypothetical protein